MIVIDYNKKQHKQIIHAVALALKHGKVVAYPTDTSYGLAIDPTRPTAIKKLYKIKLRSAKQPVHIVVGSVAQAKKYVHWNLHASKLVNKYWPGALSLVLPIKTRTGFVKSFSAGTGTLGLRMPKNIIALDLVKALGQPITATSANPSGKLAKGYDSYSAEDVIEQFSKQTHKPDIIINAGALPKKRPSTLVKVSPQGEYEILRPGPISEKQIKNTLNTK
jgi:L-threonylcarbamoyladenylate synthase